MNQTPQQKAAQYAAIDINKKYQYRAYPEGHRFSLADLIPFGGKFISATSDRRVIIHNSEGIVDPLSSCSGSNYDLIEAPRAARERTLTLYRKQDGRWETTKGEHFAECATFREVLPASPADSPDMAAAREGLPVEIQERFNDLGTLLADAGFQHDIGAQKVLNELHQLSVMAIGGFPAPGEARGIQALKSLCHHVRLFLGEDEPTNEQRRVLWDAWETARNAVEKIALEAREEER